MQQRLSQSSKWLKLATNDLRGFFRSGDGIYLVSFPKSGRTWLNFMLKEMILSSSHEKAHQCPEIFIDHDDSAIIFENGKRPNPNDLFLYGKRFKYRKGSVILMVRDPRDVIVSHYHQVTKRSINPMKFRSLSEFVRDPVYGFERVLRFYKIWHQNMNIPRRFLLVRYEDLSTNGLKVLQSVSKFIGLGLDVECLSRVYDYSEAENMRRLELVEGKDRSISSRFFGSAPNYLKVRRAKVGSYTEELSQNDIDYCNQKMLQLPAVYGYSSLR